MASSYPSTPQAELDNALLQAKSNVPYPSTQISALISLLHSKISSPLVSELKPSDYASHFQPFIPSIQHLSTLPNDIYPAFQLLADLGSAILAIPFSHPFLPSLYYLTSVSTAQRAQGIDSDDEIAQALISTDEALLVLSMQWWKSRTSTPNSVEARDISALISSISAERQKHGRWLDRDYFARSYGFLRAVQRTQALESVVLKVAGTKLPPELTDQIQRYMDPSTPSQLAAFSRPIPTRPDCEDPHCADLTCPNKMRLQWDAKLLRFKRIHEVEKSQGGWECNSQSSASGVEGCEGHCGTHPPYFGPNPMGPYLEEVMQEIIHTATRKRYIPRFERDNMNTYQKTAWDIALKGYE
ncbi:hypothetical protein AOQ84DRAFT_353966 [Glonium stellatum]|uniref:Uncharacterized protein n=1 Tax=Glonium stellatum TaxID=574774 RepID=A0A8E2F2U0_9PEZI|nr:hypothetical protein AOQ84DRAFT_353966 [Glonium stellatum]